MKTAEVVIGANYGDEGKGLVTDFLSSRRPLGSTIVVRFNGGAQAGHTVETLNARHIFGHFGSGSFSLAPTHLSRFFIVNPVLFYKEREELLKLRINPTISVSPNAIITTPQDMLINQAQQRKKGINASCGVGINETVDRSNRGFEILVADLLNEELEEKLSLIEEYWVKDRLNILGLNKSDLNILEKAVLLEPDSSTGKRFRETFKRDCLYLKHWSQIRPDEWLRDIDHIIFEGAQGLALDQNSEDFPWVTRSNTGIDNIISMYEECDLTGLDLYYITRSYLTRHGFGPLLNGQSEPLWEIIEDKTNVTNKFQGSLRYAPLNFYVMWTRVMSDVAKGFEADIDINTINVVITCMDQCPENIANEHINSAELTGCHNVLTSYGPRRDHIRIKHGEAMES